MNNIDRDLLTNKIEEFFKSLYMYKDIEVYVKFKDYPDRFYISVTCRVKFKGKYRTGYQKGIGCFKDNKFIANNKDLEDNYQMTTLKLQEICKSITE